MIVFIAIYAHWTCSIFWFHCLWVKIPESHKDLYHIWDWYLFPNKWQFSWVLFKTPHSIWSYPLNSSSTCFGISRHSLPLKPVICIFFGLFYSNNMEFLLVKIHCVYMCKYIMRLWSPKFFLFIKSIYLLKKKKSIYHSIVLWSTLTCILDMTWYLLKFSYLLSDGWVGTYLVEEMYL